MKNRKIQALIAATAEQFAQHGLERIAEGLDATKRRAFLTRSGEIVYAELEADHRVRTETAFRVLELCASSSAEELQDEQHNDILSNAEDSAESKGQAITELNAQDRNLIARAAQIEERLADVEQQLAEDCHGSEQASEN